MANSASVEYKPGEYWEGLLRDRFDLRDVGYPYLSLAFNEFLYRAMVNSVERGLRQLGLAKKPLLESSILDVGSGTGFWIEFWLTKGARQIQGIDLTDASVSRLSQRYPQLRFAQRDIADPVHASHVDQFDFISAMSILHHIPTQEKWEQAVLNLGRMLRPGGYVLIMDPILKHRWWGAPFNSSNTGRPRALAEHSGLLRQVGVEIAAVHPTVAILANPVDSRSRFEFLLLNYWWSMFSRVAAHQKWMRWTGSWIYALDRLICRLNYMPSSKIIFARKGF